MENLNDMTAMGLTALVIVLGYYAVQKLGGIFANHLERANELQMRTVFLLEKCAVELDAIKESLQKPDK